MNIFSTLSISGYAIPGVILAIAFISFIAWFDEYIEIMNNLDLKKPAELETNVARNINLGG